MRLLSLILLLALSASGSVDSIEAGQIVGGMLSRGESCESVQDFLLDTAIEHNIEIECE